MPAIKVACIGEAMVELALDRERADVANVGFAGDTLNTAIYLKRGAPALDVCYVTCLIIRVQSYYGFFISIKHNRVS